MWIKRLLGDYGDTHGGVSEHALLESVAAISGLLKGILLLRDRGNYRKWV